MRTISLTAIAALALALAAAQPAKAADNDWARVAAALGKSGTEMPGGVYRIGLPRTDLHVVLDGVQIKPTLALGSWLAFRRLGNDAIVMGDLVLTEDEVNPVMAELEAHGIEITALHNHLLRARPSTLYMHVLGHGDPEKLAAALHAGLIRSKTPLSSATSSTGSQHAAAGASPAATIDLDTALIDRTLSAKGKVVGGVYQVGIPRAEKVMEGGMEVPVAMGSAEAINFQPTSSGKAAITGDFVLTATEVNPVIRTLGDNGIEVTALHNHMLEDQPRLFFMHFWANDDAAKLARGLAAALAHVKIKRS
jgi:biotin operon repressor